jgi:hypothetical protein
MTEQLIDFETAKLAKEKGFDLFTVYWYMTEVTNREKGYRKDNWNFLRTRFSAPTQSLLQSWIQKKHGLYAYLDWSTQQVVIVDYKNYDGKELLRENFFDFCPDHIEGELLDKLLFDCLNIIA